MGPAERQASPGEVVASPEAWAALAETCRGSARDGGSVRVEEVTSSAGRPGPPAERPALPPGLADVLRAGLPGAIRSRLGAGQDSWLAELRRISVLFFGLPDLGV